MIISNSKGDKYIVKFQYIETQHQRNTRHFRCAATLSWIEMSTICSIRAINQPKENNIYVSVHCKKSDLFKKYVGRGLAFKKLICNPMLLLEFTEKDRQLFIKQYNDRFKHKIKIDE